MVEQLDIFARTTDPETSKGYKPGSQKHVLLEFIRANPRGWTPFELAERTGMQQSVVAARLTQLKRAGLIVVDGARCGGSARLCQVYKEAQR